MSVPYSDRRGAMAIAPPARPFHKTLWDIAITQLFELNA
jgi:hypothetical protein